MSTQTSESGTAPGTKGLKGGALGLVSSVVIGMASTAPAYSLAASLGLIVVLAGEKTPAIMLLAFVPMYLIAVAYRELNEAEPDCGTTFTWAARAFGPRTGWMGGWGIIAADIIVMANLAQIAGSYSFRLVGLDELADDQLWSTVAGVVWIVLMTYICYRGIEVSARLQYALLGIELLVLVAFAVIALVKVYSGGAPDGSMVPSLAWLWPGGLSLSDFVDAILIAVFLYWGWDTAVAVNEEADDPATTPGKAAVLSTVLLLVTYVLVAVATVAFAGTGTEGIGLGNPDNADDVFAAIGPSVFGDSGIGQVFIVLLIISVLTSSAASTQTTILPTARTTLSMATYKALPRSFAKMHPRYLTPTVSTIAMGTASAVLYLAFNYVSSGFIIADAVTAIGLYIAFYYGLTGFACTWYYRKTLRQSQRNLWMRGILPSLGGLIMYAAGGWSLWADWDVASENSYTSWLMPFWPHWYIGGAFVIAFLSALVGLIAGIWVRFAMPAYFRKQTLTRTTPTMVPET
jgi:amino acid transporter